MAKSGAVKPKTKAEPVNLELETTKESNKAQRWALAIRYLGLSLVIAASALPLRYVYYSVKELAGRTTYASIGVTAGVSVVGLGALARLWMMRKKMMEQTAELGRLRERVSDLEKQIEQPKTRRT